LGKVAFKWFSIKLLNNHKQISPSQRELLSHQLHLFITTTMSGLGGLNKSPQGMVVGMVQSQLPVVSNPAELAAQTMRIVEMVGKARRNMPSMDLVVFPEYSLHGLVSISPLPTHSAYQTR